MHRPSRLVAAAVVSMAMVAGCKRPPTYHRDVAPILSRRCVRCHAGEGLAALPRLDTYEQASKFAGKIRFATESRMMPPWGADDSGLCGKWRDALWLNDAEVATLVAWAERSAPAGDPADRTRAHPDPVPEVGRVDATLDTGADFAPGLGESAYRCFVVDPRLGRDRLLTGIRVTSSDPRMVAQVTLFAPTSTSAEYDAMKLDDEDPAPGYSCYGSPRIEPTRLLASWTWDAPAQPFPPGTGLRILANRKLVVQVHYNVITSGLGATTRTRIGLQLDDGVREASMVPLGPREIRLPPGQTYAEANGEMTIDKPTTLFGVAPRMHTLGRTMQLDRVQPSSRGTRTCMASFDHWNFYHQRLFTYQEPLRLSPGDRLRVSCVYDTEGVDEPIHGGDTIHDEACTAYLYTVP